VCHWFCWLLMSHRVSRFLIIHVLSISDYSCVSLGLLTFDESCVTGSLDFWWVIVKSHQTQRVTGPLGFWKVMSHTNATNSSNHELWYIGMQCDKFLRHDECDKFFECDTFFESRTLRMRQILRITNFDTSECIMSHKNRSCSHTQVKRFTTDTGWQRPIGCLKLQVSFCGDLFYVYHIWIRSVTVKRWRRGSLLRASTVNLKSMKDPIKSN